MALQLFPDASARVVWAAIVALPAALQHQILVALRNLLACLEGTGTGETRLRHAVKCLCEARDLLGHSPSVGEYRNLHASRGRELQWASDSNIRSWVGGSWNDCLREARLAPVPDGDFLVASLGSAFTADEIVEALRACAEEIGDLPTITQYFAWARRAEVKARPGDLDPVGSHPEAAPVCASICRGVSRRSSSAGRTGRRDCRSGQTFRARPRGR